MHGCLKRNPMDAIPYLAAVAQVAAAEVGHDTSVEKSGRSEATYIRIKRGQWPDDERWYGIRLARHTPYYASSEDYQQVYPRVQYAKDVPKAMKEHVEQLARFGGSVIADPYKVRERLWEEERKHRYPSRVSNCDSRGVKLQWKWHYGKVKWALDKVGGKPPTKADHFAYWRLAPKFSPRMRPLDAYIESDIRARMNQSERERVSRQYALARISRNPSRSRYRHKSVRSLRTVDRRSIRTIHIGKHGRKMLVACPRGKWMPRKKRCKAGMVGVSILTPKRKRRNHRAGRRKSR